MRIAGRARRQALRLYRACVVDGVLDERRALEAVDAVAQAHRSGGRAVLAWFLRLSRLDRDRRRAVVESAAPLPPDVRSRLETGIARAYGPGLSLSFTENAALIGGMRVRVGSYLWDGTLLGALNALEERL